jgi:hypothetical protein
MEMESICSCKTIKLHDGISGLLFGEQNLCSCALPPAAGVSPDLIAPAASFGCEVLVFVTCTLVTGVDTILANERPDLVTNQRVCFFSPNAIIDAATQQLPHVLDLREVD